MEISFSLNSPSFSINRYYYRNRKRTQEAREWGKEIHNQIKKPSISQKLEKFRKAFSAQRHVISVTYTFGIPFEKYFTKTGAISTRANDLTNVEKPLQDLIFDKRYRERDGIPTLAIDDKFVKRCLSISEPSNKYYITISLSLIPKPVNPYCSK